MQRLQMAAMWRLVACSLRMFIHGTGTRLATMRDLTKEV